MKKSMIIFAIIIVLAAVNYSLPLFFNVSQIGGKPVNSYSYSEPDNNGQSELTGDDSTEHDNQTFEENAESSNEILTNSNNYDIVVNNEPNGQENESIDSLEQNDVNLQINSELTNLRQEFLDKMSEIYIALTQFDEMGVNGSLFNNGEFKSGLLANFIIEDYQLCLGYADNILNIVIDEIDATAPGEKAKMANITNDDDKIFEMGQLSTYIADLYLAQ